MILSSSKALHSFHADFVLKAFNLYSDIWMKLVTGFLRFFTIKLYHIFLKLKRCGLPDGDRTFYKANMTYIGSSLIILQIRNNGKYDFQE